MVSTSELITSITEESSCWEAHGHSAAFCERFIMCSQDIALDPFLILLNTVHILMPDFVRALCKQTCTRTLYTFGPLCVGSCFLFICSLYWFCDFRALCARMPPSMPRLVTCLNQYGTSTVEPQRIVVAAFYAEVCFHTSHPLTLLCGRMLYFCVHSSDKHLLDYSGDLPFKKLTFSSDFYIPNSHICLYRLVQ